MLQFQSAADVTAVITACGRPDLLRRALRSFVNHFDAPLRQLIVVEDSGTDCNAALAPEFPFVTWLVNATNIGQIASIDRAYALVKTAYVFHCEEDFPLLPGFKLDASRAILEAHPHVFTVVLRGHGAPYGVDPAPPLADGTVLTTPMSADGAYAHAFTFNPGLRRMADYRRHGPYARITTFRRADAGAAERELSFYHKRAGFRLAHASPKAQ